MRGGSGALGSSASFEPAPVAEMPKRRRFGEPLKFLPVIFVLLTILGLAAIYVCCHLIPLAQFNELPHRVDADARQRAVAEFLIFLPVTTLLLICYVRSILCHPGEIPDKDPQWEHPLMDGRPAVDAHAPMNLQETKKTGDRRHCKWCGKYKPDRCHHCRVCKTCILKMDHHCPWIYNCVGFHNYKYFFLLLLYSAIDCLLILFTMAESVKRSVDVETPFVTMFLVLFGETLAFFLGMLVSMFFCFHIWLMLKAMTTIEFCEKSLPKKEKEHEVRNYDSSVYDLGFCGNIRVVLGDNMLLWLLPFALDSGDGLNFVSDQTRLTKDMETGKGIRRKAHQRTQRASRQGTYSGRTDQSSALDGPLASQYYMGRPSYEDPNHHQPS